MPFVHLEVKNLREKKKGKRKEKKEKKKKGKREKERRREANSQEREKEKLQPRKKREEASHLPSSTGAAVCRRSRRQCRFSMVGFLDLDSRIDFNFYVKIVFET